MMCDVLHLRGKGATGVADELQWTADSSVTSTNCLN